MHGVSVVPPGGWHFPSDGNPNSNADLHYESGYEELVQWLRGYRIANGFAVGNPAEDVMAFTQKNNPRNYGVVPEAPAYDPTTPNGPPKTFRERVTQWLANRFHTATAGGLTFVDEETAKTRAQICASCPQNQNWKVGCPPCVENAERLVVMMTQGVRVDQRLKGCAIAGHSNEVAVRLQESHLKHRVQYQDELPEFCWMKSL